MNLRGIVGFVLCDKELWFQVEDYTTEELSSFIPYEELDGIEEQLFADFLGYGING